ncbi:Uncharacterized protein DAT39_017111, partial [Clarias magur]
TNFNELNLRLIRGCSQVKTFILGCRPNFFARRAPGSDACVYDWHPTGGGDGSRWRMPPLAHLHMMRRPVHTDVRGQANHTCWHHAQPVHPSSMGLQGHRGSERQPAHQTRLEHTRQALESGAVLTLMLTNRANASKSVPSGLPSVGLRNTASDTGAHKNSCT